MAILCWCSATAAQPVSARIGEVPELENDKRERLARAKEEARWTWGSTKVQPLLSIRDSAWVQNAFDAPDSETNDLGVDDFTATLAVGLTVFQDIGESTTFTAWAQPEYVWWRDLEERRRLNGLFGGALYVGENRVRLDLEATRAEQQALFTPEVRELTSLRRDELTAAVEVDLYKSLGIFGRVGQRTFENLLERGPTGIQSNFDRLDRTEQSLQAGLRATLFDEFEVRVGAFDVDTTFETDDTASPSGTAGRDFDAAGLFAEIEIPGERLSFQGRVEQRDVSPQPGSQFVELEEILGFAVLALKSRNGRRSANLYTRNDLYAALGVDFAAILESVVGAGFNVRISERFVLDALFETGELEFHPLAGFDGFRTDDVERYGAGFTTELPYGLDLSVRYLDNSVDSQLDLQNRSTQTFSLQIGLRTFTWP